MESIFITIGTILATGGVMVLGNWAQHHWAGKREVSDARRKYREDIARPVREALDKVQVALAWRDLVNTINTAEAQGVSLKPETIRDKEMLEEIQQLKEARNLRKTLTEFNPLTAAITNEETRKAAQQAFASAVLSEETLNFLKITEKDVEQKFRLAYQKLEDFVTLTD